MDGKPFKRQDPAMHLLNILLFCYRAVTEMFSEPSYAIFSLRIERLAMVSDRLAEQG